MRKALENIRVIDLTAVWFGPFCTMLLADMGAEVIKIEPPWGEMTRFRPPLINGASPNFTYFNRNKKGMTLNLKSEKGVAIFKELVKIGDVVVENYSPRTMEREFGLGYDTLREVNPKIIYASLSGYGQSGPYSQRPSFDIIGQAMSGLMYLTGERADPEGPPILTSEAPGDLTPALFAAFSILTALFHRERTGIGQRIDVAQVDCMISVIPSLVTYALTGLTRQELRKRDNIPGVYDVFKARDGHVVIAAPMGHFLDILKNIIGIKDIESRQVIDDWVKTKTVEEVVDTLADARVPVAPVHRMDEVFQDPQILAREMIVEIEHPQAGMVKMPNFPVKFSETPGEVATPAPLLGQHNEEILAELLGYNREEVDKLKEEGIL